MKTMLRVLLLMVAIALAGCAPGEHLFVTNKIFNAGFEDLPPDMVERHFIAVIAFDEAHPSKLNRPSRATMYGHGVKEGSPEYGLRVARVNVRYLKGAAWLDDGEFTWTTVAAVPDHLPALKAWDIVEFRNVGTLRTLTDFSKTGEGNIVIRVLCHAQAPDYKECAAAAPKIGGKHTGGVGPTPYPQSAKAYGFTFTPAYDSKGVPLRPLPEYKPR